MEPKSQSDLMPKKLMSLTSLNPIEHAFHLLKTKRKAERPTNKHQLKTAAAFHWQRICQTCPLSSAAWALAPPNSLRYQKMRRPLLSHPLHHASQQSENCYEDDWEESHSLCVLVPQERLNKMHMLLKLPAFSHIQPEDLITLGSHSSDTEFSFPLTTVDGSREDDISIESLQMKRADVLKRPNGCIKSCSITEDCLVPFMFGSQFYCFHCPATHLGTGRILKSCHSNGLNRMTAELLLLPPTSLCSRLSRAEGQVSEGEGEEEEKLAMMYERLRLELPNFFMTNHDYTMYSNDVEFINGLLNIRSRGLLVYRLTLSLWRFLSLCYYAEARLDVLKLTKHIEDGTIKARWRIKGLPFHSFLLRFYQKDKSHLYRSYDAFSTFYIGHDGLIHCHKVEKVMPAQPPVLPRINSLLTGALVALGVQEHRPALNLLPPLLSSLRQNKN
uniref:Si:ch211-215a10.4 n=1 Tax=Fundulus heteroclitus TaxID=8078 RepID=A0A3Q2QUS0_FUNHE